MLGLIAAAAIPAAAQQTGFAVSMESKALSAAPGRAIRSELKILTPGSSQVTHCEITTLDLGMSATGGGTPVPLGQGARSCAKWISIPEQVEVPPDGELTVPFSLAVPAGAAGEYYSYINVKRLAERSNERIVVLVQPTLSVRVEVDVPGRRRAELRASRLSFDPTLMEGEPGLLLTVENPGETHSGIEGDILLYGERRRMPIRATIPVRPDGIPVQLFPGLDYELACPLSELPAPGTYRAEVRLLMADRWAVRSEFEIRIPDEELEQIAVAGLQRLSEQDLDFSVEPNFLEVILPKGGRRTLGLRVVNRDDVAVTARAEFQDFSQELNGFMTFTQIAQPDRHWARLRPQELFLAPHSAISLIVELERPEWLLPTEDKPVSTTCAVRIRGSVGKDQAGYVSEIDIGVPVIVVSPSALPPQLEIVGLDVIRPSPGANPTAAVFSLQNAGGRTAVVKGSLLVEREGSQQRIQTMYLGRHGNLILPPGVAREFRMPMPMLDKDTFRLTAEASLPESGAVPVGKSLAFTCTKGPS